MLQPSSFPSGRCFLTRARTDQLFFRTKRNRNLKLEFGFDFFFNEIWKSQSGILRNEIMKKMKFHWNFIKIRNFSEILSKFQNLPKFRQQGPPKWRSRYTKDDCFKDSYLCKCIGKSFCFNINWKVFFWSIYHLNLVEADRQRQGDTLFLIGLSVLDFLIFRKERLWVSNFMLEVASQQIIINISWKLVRHL